MSPHALRRWITLLPLIYPYFDFRLSGSDTEILIRHRLQVSGPTASWRQVNHQGAA